MRIRIGVKYVESRMKCRVVLCAWLLPFVVSVCIAEPPATPARFQFKLVEGANLPVCAAYLERLNSTSFDVTPLCGRPENASVPGFEVLPRKNLTPEELYGISEQLFGFALHSDPEYYDHLRARELAYCRDPDNPMCKHVMESQRSSAARGTRWREPTSLESLRKWSLVWKYDPPIDIDNDGTPDPILLFRSDRCGGINWKNVLELAPTYAFVMDSAYRTIDIARTRAIFGHPNPVWPGAPSPRFRYIGLHFGVFAYRGQVYYDTYFNSLGDFEDRRKDGAVLSSTLGVFRRAGNLTKQVCELRLLDR